jgi:PRC-barrel domain
MLNVEQIEDWVGQEVLDSENERVGKLEDVFYSTAGGDAVFASVKSGLLGRHSDVVPLASASVGRSYVRVAYTKEQIADANSDVDTSDGVHRESARRLGVAYGIELRQDEDFESATVINERKQALADARGQADALEEQARRRAAEADAAQGTAQSAHQDATEKSEQSERAQAQAEQARADAERIARPSRQNEA